MTEIIWSSDLCTCVSLSKKFMPESHAIHFIKSIVRLLYSLALQLQVAGINHQANTLLFGMFGGYFIHYNISVSNPQLSDWVCVRADLVE